MRKIVVEITGKSGKSFDLTLCDTAWFGIEGNWNCLPGFLPSSTGYFDFNSSYNVIHLWNRERTIGEALNYAFDGDSPAPTKIHGALEGFPSSPAAGTTGKGNIFDHGKTAAQILKDHLGIVCSGITWKIKSVG